MKYDLRFITGNLSIKIITWHIALIILIMIFEIGVVKLMGSPLSVYYFLPYYIPDILFFYINAFVIMSFWKQGSIMSALVFIGIALSIHYALSFGINVEINNELEIKTTRIDYIRTGYRTMYIFFISLTYWIVLRNRRQAQEIYELKLQHLKQQNDQVILENAYLRAKANPHLTFNILNALYAAIEQKMPMEAKAVKLLSHTIDFSLGNTDPDGKIILGEEIKQIREKIELYQYLNKNRYRIMLSANLPSAACQLKIPPLLLVTLLDNVFMHGNLMDEDHPATIEITCLQNKFVYVQRNLALEHSRTSHGLGLNFVRKCLSFYYPERFAFIAESEKNIFTVNLIIDL